MNFTKSNVAFFICLILLFTHLSEPSFSQDKEKTAKKKARQNSSKINSNKKAASVDSIKSVSDGKISASKNLKNPNAVGSSPQKLKKTSAVKTGEAKNEAFLNAEIENEISKIIISGRGTDSIAFFKETPSFDESIKKFRKSLSSLLQEETSEFAAFKEKFKQKKAENEDYFKSKSVLENNSSREKNLNSFKELLVKEENSLKSNELKKIKGRLDGLFNNFLQTLNTQKKFFINNSEYKNNVSEINLIFDSFEAELKNKNNIINRHIEKQFNDIEK